VDELEERALDRCRRLLSLAKGATWPIRYDAAAFLANGHSTRFAGAGARRIDPTATEVDPPVSSCQQVQDGPVAGGTSGLLAERAS